MTIELHGRVHRGNVDIDIDLSIEPGLTFVTGENGAGKTSLLRTIAGLEALDTGSLSIDGSLLDDATRAGFVPAHRRDVALLFQDHRLFPHLSAADNVAFALRHRRGARSTAIDTVDAALALVGMAGLGDRRPDALSRGQQQRVAIARALATGARTILLDEPLAAVDDAGRADLGERLTAIAATHIVWVTHDPVDPTTSTQLVSAQDGIVRKTASP